MPLPEPCRYAEDRTIAVPPGRRVVTRYADVFAVRHASRARMDFGVIERAGQRLLQLGGSQPWPPPVVRWDGAAPILLDGRHLHLAAIALGFTHLLVASLEPDR